MHVMENGIAILDGGDQLSKDMQEHGLVLDYVIKDFVPALGIKPGDWILDGGAALGDHTRAYLDAVGPTGQVIAFEPHPEFFKCLRHNCPEALAINRILFHEPNRQFYLHTHKGNVGAGYISQRSEPEFVGRGDYVSGPINSMRIDDLCLDKLDVLKLDVEGAEYFALIGGKQTIQRCRPKLLVEVNEGHMLRQGVAVTHLYDLIHRMGYTSKSIRGDQTGYCDLLCLPT